MLHKEVTMENDDTFEYHMAAAHELLDAMPGDDEIQEAFNRYGHNFAPYGREGK